MRLRIACLLAVLSLSLAGFSQKALDFASKFMQRYESDTALNCVTVSPKMIESLVHNREGNRTEQFAEAIEKLKSVRIVTAKSHGDLYYEKAEGLLKENSKRFTHEKEYNGDHGKGTFYTRKNRRGERVELVMLHTDTQTNSLVIVNLTGDIDEDFLNSLSKDISGKTARAY